MTNSEYEIHVREQLDPRLSHWFDGVTVEPTGDGGTLLRGVLPDQTALYGLLARCRDLGLTLISVHLVSPDALAARIATEEPTMNSLRVEVSRAVDATPDAVLSLFRDYRVAHAAVLPKPYFVDMVIDQGGYGAGTVVRVKMKAYGVEKNYRFDVTEPEPGRILAETDPSIGLVTHFIADPLDGGARSMVTLSTLFPIPGGIAGWFERKMTPGLMRRIYQQELQNVANYLARKAAQPTIA